MRTYPLRGEEGHLVALEVDMPLFGVRNIMKIISSSDGVSDICIGSGRIKNSDVRASFKYFGFDYVVVEPFGDNDRYWIGPVDDGLWKDISSIERKLREFKPSIWPRLIFILFVVSICVLLWRQ